MQWFVGGKLGFSGLLVSLKAVSVKVELGRAERYMELGY